MCVCVEGKEKEIYWKGRGKEMISGSFMWGKVGLLSVGAPRQESYYYRKLEQPSPALHLDKIHPPKKKRDTGKEKQMLWCVSSRLQPVECYKVAPFCFKSPVSRRVRECFYLFFLFFYSFKCSLII